MSDTAGQIPALRALSGRLAAGHPETDDEVAGWDAARPDVSSTLPTRPPPAPAAKPSSTTPPTAEEQTLIERRNSVSRLQAALEASTRTDATLSGLFRAIQHLTEGVSGARETNETLIVELEALRSLLGLANEQQLSYKHKLTLLEQSLERQRQRYEQEKNYLITQHDAFIAELIEDHEAELDTLRTQFASAAAARAPIDLDRLSSIPPAPAAGFAHPATTQPAGSEVVELERQLKKLNEEQQAARETLLRLQAQRDEAQAAVARVTRDRDEAKATITRLQTELGGPRVSLSAPPPPVAESRRTPPGPPVMSAPVSAPPPPLQKPAPVRTTPRPPANMLKLDQPELDAVLSKPPAVAPVAGSTKPTAAPSSAASPPASAKPPSGSSASNIPRLSPPPEELRAALTGAHFPPLAIEPARPPLKQKPDPSTRPLIGYSLGSESVRPEKIEGVTLSSKPPASSKK